MTSLDLGFMANLRSKMMWHQDRQTILAQNIANADTAGFKGKDLIPFQLDNNTRNQENDLNSVSNTPGHFKITSLSGAIANARAANGLEVRPNGNAISLEDETLKLTTNQIEFQAASTLYTRSLRMLRLAMGKAG